MSLELKSVLGQVSTRVARIAATALASTPLGPFAWKVVDLLEKEGIAGVVGRIGRKAIRRDREALRARLKTLAADRPVLLLLPSVDWEVALFQRSQQLALAMAERGWAVFYVTPNQSAGWSGVRERAPGCWVIDDLDAAAVDNAAVMISSTAGAAMSLALVRQLQQRMVTIYDFLDDQNEAVYRLSPEILERHRALVTEADLVTVTALRLADEVAAIRRPDLPVLEIPNAADIVHFAPKPRKIPADMSKFGDQIVIGYYGALATWFDYELVKHLATARPRYQIVLIGVDYDQSVTKAGLSQFANIHCLGPRNYRDLPDYLARFDVATIPFIKSSITDATSPIKLFEYMAAEKPIVTTDLEECRRYRSVSIAKSPADFVTAIDDALSRSQDPSFRAQLRADAQANSWPGRAQQLDEALRPLLGR